MSSEGRDAAGQRGPTRLKDTVSFNPTAAARMCSSIFPRWKRLASVRRGQRSRQGVGWEFAHRLSVGVPDPALFDCGNPIARDLVRFGRARDIDLDTCSLANSEAG